MKNKGFTLIELLVVMTIIALLLGLSLVSYQGARKVARDGQRKADLEEIRSALEMCRTDTGSYPGSLSSGSPLTCGGETYLDEVPSDPLSGRQYAYSGSADSYSLYAALEIDTGDSYSGDCGDATCNYQVTNP